MTLKKIQTLVPVTYFESLRDFKSGTYARGNSALSFALPTPGIMNTDRPQQNGTKLLNLKFGLGFRSAPRVPEGSFSLLLVYAKL